MAKLVNAMLANPSNIAYNDLVEVCQHYFGAPRQDTTSHAVYTTRGQGDPRANIQNKQGKAKPYQVRQVLSAIVKLEEKK